MTDRNDDYVCPEQSGRGCFDPACDEVCKAAAVPSSHVTVRVERSDGHVDFYEVRRDETAHNDDLRDPA